MTNGNEATVAIQASGIDVSLTAEPIGEDVECKLKVNEQSVTITFTGTDVVVDVGSNA